MSNGAQPRRIAWEVLMAVDTRAAYANLMLPALLRQHGCHGRDAAFATDLTYTTLRWRGLVDAVLESASSRAIDEIDVTTRNILRIAGASWLIGRTAAHAAVSTAVDLAGEIGADKRGRGFVNAVLRRVTEHSCEGWQQRLGVDATDSASLAVKYSHPRWMVDAIGEALVMSGRDPSDIEQVLAADNDAVAPTLVARPGLCEVQELLTVDANTPGRWADTAVYTTGGDPGRINAVAQYRAGVQDEGSQLVALIAAGVHVDGSDTAWLDACAGPGGKAALLGALAAGRGAHVTAVEHQQHRAQLIASTVAELTSVEVVHADATALSEQPWYRDAMFDRVLVDVPCSGLGALRRRPDLRWQRGPRDVADLASTQESLLVAAFRAVRPGGVVTYATCSPHTAETIVVTARAVRSAQTYGIQLEQVNLSAELTNIDHIDGAALVATLHGRPQVQLWPDVHGTDAMFVSVWRRL